MKRKPDVELVVKTLALLVLGAAFLVLAAVSLGQPLGFDESYNLEIVGHLLHDHHYATDGLLLFPDQSREFDYRITTGPTVMLPVAALAALLGEHVWVYRLVPIAFFLVLTAGWFKLGRDLAGFWVGAAAAAAVLALDTGTATWGTSTYFGPGDVLGEVAAAALVVLAVLTTRRPAISGPLVGLALMAKTIIVLAVPVVAVGVLWPAWRKASTRAAAVRFAAGLVTPVLAWQVVRFAMAGPDAAREANADFMRFLLNYGGSGLGAEPSDTSLADKLTAQAELVPGPVVVTAVVLALLVVLVLVGVLRRTAPPRTDDETAEDPIWLPLLLAGAAGSLIELWWLVLADHAWVRHSLIAAFLVFPALVCAAANALTKVRSPGPRLLAGLACAALLVSGVALHLDARLTYDGPALADQRRVAERLRQVPGGYMYAGRNQLADLMLLGAPTPRTPDERGGLMVLRHDDVTANVDFDAQLAACGPVVFDDGGFVGCEVPAGEVPPALRDWNLLERPDG